MSETDSEKKIKRRARKTKEELDGSSASGIRKAGDTDLGLFFHSVSDPCKQFRGRKCHYLTL